MRVFDIAKCNRFLGFGAAMQGLASIDFGAIGGSLDALGRWWRNMQFSFLSFSFFMLYIILFPPLTLPIAETAVALTLLFAVLTWAAVGDAICPAVVAVTCQGSAAAATVSPVTWSAAYRIVFNQWVIVFPVLATVAVNYCNALGIFWINSTNVYTLM